MAAENSTKVQFHDRIEELLAGKGKNNQFFDHEGYLSLVNRVTQLKSGVVKKTPSDYSLLKKYDVVQVGGVTKLICPMTESDARVMYYVEKGKCEYTFFNKKLRMGEGSSFLKFSTFIGGGLF